MPIPQLLFSFHGRIGRQVFWLSSIAVSVLTGMANGVLQSVAETTGHVAKNSEGQLEPTGVYLAAMGVIGVAVLWINLAITAKRLHDRDRTAWWLALQAAGVILTVVAVAIALLLPNEQRVVWYGIAAIIGVPIAAISLWLFIEMGFLRGTQGPNRFGPDPLGAVQADATLS